MSKKLVYLVCLVLMIGLAVDARADLADWEAAISAGNPLHWYKFDETSGTDCIDSGSAGLNGTYTGVSSGEQGYFGPAAAAEFTRADGDVVDFADATDLSGSWTAEYIVKTVKPPAGQEPQALHDSAATSIRLAAWSALGEAGFTLYGVADYQFTPVTGLTLNDLVVQQDEWMHLVWRRNSSGTQVFFNGKLVGTSADSIALGRLRIGGHGAVTNALDGVLDEAVVFDRALTDADIIAHAEAASLIDRSIFQAGNPDPPDAAIGVTMALLRWTPGVRAALHDVYFGTTPDLGPTDFAAQNPKFATLYYHAAGLTAGTTYYWRIDEIEGDGATIHTGNVWSFTAAPSTAWDPSPPDGAQFQDVDVDLSWVPGMNAFKHDVYFGTDETAVAEGAPDTSKGKVSDITFDPGTLARGTTYYWRIDEVEIDDTTHKGHVWSFTTIPVIPISDPNLVGWWKLDEGQGSTALDWSGYENHGTFVDDPQWVAGYDGGALQLDGTDSVDCGNSPELQITEAITIACWVNPAGLSGDRGFVGWDGAYTLKSSGDHLRFTTPGIRDHDAFNAILEAETWQHVAMTFQPDQTGGAVFYINGVEADRLDGSAVNPGTGPFHIGTNQWSQTYTGLIDDVRVYNKVLSPEELKQAMRGDPLLAWNPNPAKGSTPDIDGASVLSWSPGDQAVQHDVYLGTDENAVADADASDTTGIYQGRQSAAEYAPTEALEWGRTYYWRIDEYNADTSISKGRLWSFTVAEYLIVDEFEDYNDYSPDRIWQTWRDGFGFSDPPPGYAGNGTGSQVGNDDQPFTEQNTVHGGRQSMTFRYTNDGSTGKELYSETERQWAVPQDWTRNNVGALSVWFYGETTNAPGRLYIAVQDSSGVVKDVPHGDPQVLLAAGWQEWNIALNDFADAGVNLSSVKKMYIGVGNRFSPQMGGRGRLYFDDIRIYRPRCMPSLLKLDADLTGDCLVNYADLETLVGQWLTTGHRIMPADPGTIGLVAHYRLEGNANDAVGGHNGSTSGMVSYTSGKIGQAILLDGVDDMVSVGSVGISGAAARTIAGWARANATTAIPDWTNVFGFTNDLTSGQADRSFDIQRRGGQMQYCIHVYGWERNIVELDLDWHHLAATYDGTMIKWYGDGRFVNSEERTLDTIDNVQMGKRGDNYNYFPGRVDEVRIYSRALSEAEIAWLAGKTEPFSEPVDLNVDGTVDFKDFTVLADAWLDELLWP